MIVVAGYSLKAWWLSIGIPVAAYIAASVAGVVVALMLVAMCVRCRRRWLRGARGVELLTFDSSLGDHRER